MVAIKALAVIFPSILSLSLAQHFTTCDTTTTFDAAGQGSYVNSPEDGNSNPFCTYTFIAPVNHFLRANISFNVDGVTPYCSSNQYVAVSIDNMANWDGYSRFCGYRDASDPVVIQSIGNEMKLGVSSSYSNQYVSISVEVLPLVQGSCDCSWTPRMRVINGIDAVKNEFVAHVAFKAQIGSFLQTFCGGTIISQYHAITAGHCVANINDVYGLESVIMRVGSHNITALLAEDTVYAEEYKLFSAVHHQYYNNPQNAYDIGIVTTSTYIRYTRGVGPACLPFSYAGFYIPESTPLTAVGFGSTEYAMDAEYDTESWILKKVTLYTDSTVAEDCYSDVICAIGSQDGYARGDTCTRDSGGPLYGFIKNRNFFFGVISRGVDCGALNSYSYNMYTVYYINWIRSQIGDTFLCDLR